MARAIAFYALGIVVLGAAGYLLVSGLFPSLPTAAPNTIDISASMSGFSSNIIHVRAGEEVTVRLTSVDNQFHTDGGGQHQWAVDELGLNIVAPALGSESLTFIPDQQGTYTFYCDICCGGRANPTMQGTLIVEA
ncbi:MAG: cupredoxin domain-containing protein [Anaerolineae bacterium]|nr:cupredoxin domain-containing protein [Anaerolineae bacterium]